MLTKPIPAWILLGGLILTCGAGCINAVGFLGVHHQALSHMSGTGTIFSTELVLEQYAAAWHALLVLGFFLLGCVVSGLIIHQTALKAGRRYGVALVGESALLFAATYFLRHNRNEGDYLAAMACGLQNAMATSYSGAVIRTTHITGLITDLGIALGVALRGERVDRRRIGLFLVLVGGFILGGILGGLGYIRFGVDTLLFPAVVTGVTGLSYTLYTYFDQRTPVAPAR
jgi:uncharacterized membrane protein YoaK (UPF0700 family)